MSHPELLTDEAEAVLAEYWPKVKHDLHQRQSLQARWCFLHRSRVAGIDIAFGEITEILMAVSRASRAVLSDVDQAVEIVEDIQRRPCFADCIPAFRANVLKLAGIVYHARYTSTQDRRDLKRAIEHVRQVVRGDSSDSEAVEVNTLFILADSLLKQYQVDGSQPDLDEAINLLELIVEETPPSSPQLPTYLNGLATGLMKRHLKLGSPADLGQAIGLLRQSLAHLGSGSNKPAEVANCSTNLGTALMLKFSHLGNLADLEEGINLFKQAVTGTASESPEMPGFLVNLGLGLLKRYENVRNLADLEEAVELFDRVVDEARPGSHMPATRLDSLATALLYRYRHIGREEDLERCIATQERALRYAPAGSPSLPALLSNLGTAFRERYDRSGDVTDLEQAIQHTTRAIALAPIRDTARPLYLNERGIELRRRHNHERHSDDLEQAIRDFQEAVEQTPSTSPELVGRLLNLGTALEDRYDTQANLADLSAAVNYYRDTVENALFDSEMVSIASNNLGMALMKRYSRFDDPTDLEQSIEAFKRAVALVPEGSPQLPLFLGHLGRVLIIRYDRSRDLGHLAEAIDIGERCLTLYRRAFAAAPVAHKLGQQRDSATPLGWLVYAYLQRADFGESTAHADRRRAMEIAEWSKSKVLTEVLGRHDVPVPLAVPSELATRERLLLDELSAIDRAELAGYGSREQGSRLDRLQQRSQAAERLEGIWNAIARIGLSGQKYVALRRGNPLTWDDVTNLADRLGSDTALFSLFSTASDTHLFIVRPQCEAPAIVKVNLNAVGWRDLSKRLVEEVHEYGGLEQESEGTWAAPLIAILKHAEAHLRGVSRIILAPESWGHHVPWAVVIRQAGVTAANGSPMPSVILPSLGSLPLVRSYRKGRGIGSLVVGDPLGDLGHASLEASMVGERLHTQPLLGSVASKAAVLQSIGDVACIHLATHASFDPRSPLDSHVVFADDQLTAREIMALRIKADLVVLSACQTGLAHALGGDELAGLAQAFLYAGARSLLVSLWPVADDATAHLMGSFYEALESGADKALALSRAMTTIRAQSRWSHPYYWGAFQLIGDWD